MRGPPKLTALIVRGMRQRYLNGWSQSRLANEYGISIGHVGRIVRGEAWQLPEAGWIPPAEGVGSEPEGPRVIDKGDGVG